MLNSNTTFVKVKYKADAYQERMKSYSNTTFVKVKLNGKKNLRKKLRNSNTTFVKVKFTILLISFITISIQIQHLLKLNQPIQKGKKNFLQIQIQHLLKLNKRQF